MSLFADDMTVHTENPMQYTKKSISLARLKDTKINTVIHISSIY